MPEKAQGRASITAFVAIAYILSWTCWIPLALLYPPPSATAPGGSPDPSIVVQQILGNYGPSLAALIMLALFGKRRDLLALLARLRPRRAHLGWYGIVLLVPLVVLLPGLLAYALLGGTLSALPWADVLPAFLLAILVSGLGEELGWRGYALPRLQAGAGPLAPSVILGLLWAGWHLPVFCWASTETGAWLVVEFALYALLLTAFSVVFTWVYRATNASLWPVVLLHAALTATFNQILVALSPGRAGTWVPYLVSVLAACGAALWCLARLAAQPGQRPEACDTNALFRV